MSKSPLDVPLIKALRECNPKPPKKLIEHCGALNTAYKSAHYINCAILMRAILDYIPTIFGYKNTINLSSQLNGRKTFKKALDQIDQAIRNIADDALHSPANSAELIKISKPTIDNQIPNLIIVLDEVHKQLRKSDLRDEGNALINQEKKIVVTASANQLEIFEKYIESEQWYKEFIDQKEIWICKKDNLFQIHEQNDREDFSEPWTQVYPDALGSGRHSVDLVYNGNHIKRFTLVYCDGGRISVIIPRSREDKRNIWENKDILKRSYKNIGYYWESKSLEFKLTKLIGSFYIFGDIQGVARMSKIDII